MSINIAEMMAKVQEMQTRMAETQEKLSAMEKTVEVGGGMVKVTITGKSVVKRIAIEPSVLTNDAEMLEDLLLSAVNAAIRESQAMANEEMSKNTAGLLPSIPGLDLSSLGI